MKLWESVRMALRALAANKGRSSLTMLGIIIGVTAVIALMSIGRGAESSIRTEIEGLYQCSAAVAGGGIHSGGGYSCFKVICEDHELPRIWEKPGRIY